MRKLSLFIITLALALPLAVLTLVILAVEDHPRVDRRVILTPEHMERAKQIVDAHRDWVRPGMLASARIMPADADLAANYLANRFGKGSAQLALADRNAVIRLSLPLNGYPLDGYLNLEATLIETTELPQLQSVNIGKLSLPDALTDMLLPQLVRWLRDSPEYRTGLDTLRLVKMSPDELSIFYRWEGGVSDEVRASVIDKVERERLLRYQSLLAANSRRHGAAVSLAEVLPPLVRLAGERSVNGEVLAENRALILVTTFYVLGISLERILPEAAGWPRPARRTVTIDGREDFAKHFMVSASIAAYADTTLADAIGLYKEVEDSRSGSGFSFNDIAADRAGTKFGEKAVASESSAQQLQRRVAAGLKDSDLMPVWSDLPEFMPEAEFKRRFGGVDAPAYRGMMQKIEQRVAALRVLH
ncbi:hypothetical protein C8R32_10284 [Nitrosospira sp. Nsp5]|uniref:Uncharacterized protein n=1 Tax=Nitrosospira multiformis TaxID=1231 RepID=A0ABY0TL15_9PROT|nr:MULTISPECIES: hypothetical protein [Nitrosospira]PTR09997.1 hypothetical protein C8R32_10284 [Nitrosospira sp. Nsp5]SDQ99629.1 hypothetical protein SAMN05216402_3174 [Nitrosospira multiformis]